jgi:hypothetical protein
MASQGESKELIDKIAKIVANQHHHFSAGEVRSLQKAQDWIREASKKLEEAADRKKSETSKS